MNNKEKVLNAVRHYNECCEAMVKAEAVFVECRKQTNHQRDELARVLHSVYGERAANGVVVDGVLYRAENGMLVEEKASFEVLL